MLIDLLCLLKYGHTRFGLMEHYTISIILVFGFPDTWQARSVKGIHTTNITAYGALITCVELIREGEL